MVQQTGLKYLVLWCAIIQAKRVRKAKIDYRFQHLDNKIRQQMLL